MNNEQLDNIIILNDEDGSQVNFFSGGSFTNILETLMVPNCHIMASVDYRYNDSGISLFDYAKENSADYVIYIPSQSNDAFGYSKMLEHLGY